jgi:putative oxidoreductase
MTNENAGKLILRVVLGLLFLLHGIAKLKGGTAFIAGSLESAGLPALLQYGVYLGEVVGPLLLISGWYARIGGWLVAVNMLFALGLVHSGELAALNPQSGGMALETQYLFLFAAVAVALLGPGRYAVNQK